MSNVDIIIEERAAELGNFLAGRLLPFKQKRMVGPFIFIDHMGPAELPPGEGLDIGAHPHIGLSTLTFLFEGAIMHRDSLGNEVIIGPGAVNWMTAGRGVVHSERTPDNVRYQQKNLHGLQIWIALPKDKEQIAPSFQHYDSASLPSWVIDEVEYKLIAGKLVDKEAPVAVYSPLYMLEIKNNTSTPKDINIGENLYGEAGMYILEGEIASDGNIFGNKQLLVAKEATLCTFTLMPNSIIYIFGGTPFEEERFIFWNFVSSDKAILDKAITDWNDNKFPPVINETDRLSLPQYFKDKLNNPKNN